MFKIGQYYGPKQTPMNLTELSKKFATRQTMMIASGVLTASLLIGGGFLLASSINKQYNTIVVKKGDIAHTVYVSGKVVAAQQVGLSFERQGQVAEVLVNVNDRVKAGQPLVKLDQSDMAAQLEQYRAGEAAQLARLDEMRRGTRPEEMTIANQQVVAATTSYHDAQKNVETVKAQVAADLARANSVRDDAATNLNNVTLKTNLDLQNLYVDLPELFNDAYAKADDAVNHQVDPLFISATTANPQLSFVCTDSQAQTDVLWQRVLVAKELNNLRQDIKGINTDQGSLDNSLTVVKNHLAVVRDFLNRTADTINSAGGLSSATLAVYKSQVAIARSEVQGSLLTLTNRQQAISGLKQGNVSSLFSAKAQLNAAESALSFQQAVENSQITAAITQMNLAQNALATAQQNYNLKRAGSTPDQIKAQEAAVMQVDSQVASQVAVLNKMTLVSPFDGLVARQDAKVGLVVTPNTPYVSLLADKQFQVEAQMPEVDVAGVQVGQTAQVSLDAYGDNVKFEAKVVSLDSSATVTNGANTYKVVLQFTQDDPRIKSGMTANATITTDKHSAVISIPQRAVTPKGDQLVVSILVDKKPQEVQVMTGLQSADGTVEILSGLREGDVVVLSQK